MKELEGKTAFVTGASRGLGKDISLELIKRGVYVIGASRSGPPEDLEEHIAAGRASYETADLLTDWRSVVEKIYDEHGGYEIFVNNAGSLSVDFLTRLDPLKVAGEINLDLVVPTLIHRAWFELFNKNHPDAKTPELSVNLCSVSSLYSWAGGTPYQISKTGLSALVWGLRATQQYLREAADERTKEVLGPIANLNMRVVAIYPDSIDTGMISKAEEDSLYKVRGDLLPPALVVKTIMQTIEGLAEFGEYDDIVVLANPTDPKTREELKGIYVAFLPIDPETRRPNFQERILKKIAGEEQLIKREQ